MKLFFLRNGATTQNDDFLQIIHKIFSVARFIGISSFKCDRFFIWTLIVFIGILSIEVAAIWKVIRLLAGLATNTSVGFVARFSGAIFYGNTLLSLVFSIRFFSSWNKLSYQWYKADSHTGLSLPPDLNIRRRAIIITVFVTICAVDEYTLWIAIPIFITSKMATAVWNFQDLIIILISMGLTSRYHRLNLFVKQVIRREKRNKDVEKHGTDAYLQVQTWRRVREAYVRQAALVRQVDRALGPVTLLSNFNLYFICLQLFHGIGKLSGSFIHRTYYFVSLSWLLFRACSVVLAASDIYAHSSMALSSLYKCPGSSYNVEIKRLINQLTHDDVALTGMSFFSLNRRLLLKVAAVILKYELVLIQYDKN